MAFRQNSFKYVSSKDDNKVQWEILSAYFKRIGKRT
jgi:hypothetical protein